jgi:superfamily II DNA or RNA helicase
MLKELGIIYVYQKLYEPEPKTIKIGSTKNFVYRMNTYKTSERDFDNKSLEIWKFDILKSKYDCSILDKIIRYYSTKKNSPYKYYSGSGGIEHYYHDDIEKLTDFFDKLEIIYKIEKINVDKLREETKKIDFKESEKIFKEEEDEMKKIILSHEIKEDIKKKLNKGKTPRIDQQVILDETVKYFKNYDKGVLVLMCGIGKTLISLWVCQMMGMNTILIGVPNILLLEQWEKEIKEVFFNTEILLVKSGVKKEDIQLFLNNNKNNCIVVTSYSSCHKVLSVTNNNKFEFDMKINDECHHLTSSNIQEDEMTKTYIEMIHIKSKKQLSLTATIKYLENTINDNITISNSSIEYFGEIITKRNLLWAITKKILCDYIIQTIITDEDELKELFVKFNINEEKYQRLFLSAYSTLKSINDGNSHHLLIYLNKIDNSEKVLEYINLLLKEKYFNIPNLFSSTYDGEMNSKTQNKILDNFEKHKYGIICCVFCLGEGWDFPLLDGVVISENMTTNIRIVQSTLRASRKNKSDPTKLTKIILPILNKDDWLDNSENNDLKKVREVIYQLSLEDEPILTKLRVCKINIKKHKENQLNDYSSQNNFGEYDERMTENLKLKSVPRYALDVTYEKAKKIIIEKDFKVRNKNDYFNLCDKDIRLPRDPEIRFRGKFDWIDYLGIEHKYYDKDNCVEKIEKYLNKYPEIKQHNLNLELVCKELCKLDDSFPPYGLWVEYYKIKNLENIININFKKKKVFLL